MFEVTCQCWVWLTYLSTPRRAERMLTEPSTLCGVAMDRVDSIGNGPFRGRMPQRVGRVASIVLMVVLGDLQSQMCPRCSCFSWFWEICLVILSVPGLSLQLRLRHRETAKVLETREREFHH